MKKFNELPDELLRHSREYGLIPLSNAQKYALIQELFPTFSIERLDKLTKELADGLNTLDEDQLSLFNALDNAHEYEIYGKEELTINSHDLLDLPYPAYSFNDFTHIVSGIKDIDKILSLLEISNTLKFKATNRDTFAAMIEEGEKYLPFNEKLYNKLYSNVSLNSVIDYAQKLHSTRNTYNTVSYSEEHGLIWVNTDKPINGNRQQYVKLCMSISQIL